MPGLLAFHAHPDDESLSMGGTLARYAAAGEQVVVVTATKGEAGEVHNYQDPGEVAKTLGTYREAEIDAAIAALGVPHHHFLGYRDSGMMGAADNDHPESFWNAPFMEATGRLVQLIRRYQPEVVTAYDPYGGYGHPDHIQVHRIGTAAFYGAGDVGRFPVEDGLEAWTPQKLYWATFPRSAVKRLREVIDEGGDSAPAPAEEPSAGTMDEDINVWVSTDGFGDRKEAAVLAHRTQIPADSWLRLLDEDTKKRFFGREPFIRVFSRVGANAEEDDLFAGLR